MAGNKLSNNTETLKRSRWSTPVSTWWYLTRSSTAEFLPGTGSLGKLVKHVAFKDENGDDGRSDGGLRDTYNNKLITPKRSGADNFGKGSGSTISTQYLLSEDRKKERSLSSGSTISTQYLLSEDRKKERSLSSGQNIVVDMPISSMEDLVKRSKAYYKQRRKWETLSSDEKNTLENELVGLEREFQKLGINHNKLYSIMLNYYEHNSFLMNLFRVIVADSEFGFTGFFEADVVFKHTTSGLETVFKTPAFEYLFFGGVAVAATIGFFLHTVATIRALFLKDDYGKSVYNKKQKVGLMLDWLVQLGATVCIDWAICAALWQSNAQTATLLGTGLSLLPGLFIISLGLQFLADFTKFGIAFYRLCQATDHDERRSHAQTMMHLGLKMIKTALMGAFVGLMMIAGVSNPFTLGVIVGTMLLFAVGLFIWDHLPKSCQRNIKSSCSFFKKNGYERKGIEMQKIRDGDDNKREDDQRLTQETFNGDEGSVVNDDEFNSNQASNEAKI